MNSSVSLLATEQLQVVDVNAFGYIVWSYVVDTFEHG